MTLKNVRKILEHSTTNRMVESLKGKHIIRVLVEPSCTSNVHWDDSYGVVGDDNIVRFLVERSTGVLPDRVTSYGVVDDAAL